MKTKHQIKTQSHKKRKMQQQTQPSPITFSISSSLPTSQTQLADHHLWSRPSLKIDSNAIKFISNTLKVVSNASKLVFGFQN
jgi:hypothetical protein